MKAKVTVMPKASVLDPQGVAVRSAIEHLGLERIGNVRVGKFIEMELPEGTPPDQVHAICRDLLSNPVIEDYKLELES
jgi:phosphoribosylformylglycinamidine synthase PurS subunit